MSGAEPRYTRTIDRLPDDGVVVMTMGPGGVEQPLKRSGKLWSVPDGSMYVYFTPIAWRPLVSADAD